MAPVSAMRFGAIGVAAEALPGSAAPDAKKMASKKTGVSSRLRRAPRPSWSCRMMRPPMLCGYHPERVLPGTLHVPCGDLCRALLVSRRHCLDELAVLFARERPFVEPKHVDPCEEAQPIIDLQQRLADEAVAALARDHLVDAEPQLNLLPQFLRGRLGLPLELGELPHDRLELANALGGALPRRRPHRMHFEELAEFVDLVDRLRIEFRREVTQAGLVDGKAIPFEPSQRLAQRRPAHLNPARQVALAEALARPTSPDRIIVLSESY